MPVNLVIILLKREETMRKTQCRDRGHKSGRRLWNRIQIHGLPPGATHACPWQCSCTDIFHQLNRSASQSITNGFGTLTTWRPHAAMRFNSYTMTCDSWGRECRNQGLAV